MPVLVILLLLPPFLKQKEQEHQQEQQLQPFHGERTCAWGWEEGSPPPWPDLYPFLPVRVPPQACCRPWPFAWPEPGA